MEVRENSNNVNLESEFYNSLFVYFVIFYMILPFLCIYRSKKKLLQNDDFKEEIIISIEIYKEKTITEDYVEFKVECDGEMYDFIVKWEDDKYTFYYLNGKKPDYPNFEHEILCRMSL